MRSADPPPAIRTEGLRKRFKKVVAVDGVDLEIRAGEVFGLLGPNGAGKTTLLKMLVTVLPPTDGEASVGGISIRRDPAGVRGQVGMVFQEPSLDTLLTARENLHLHGRLYGVPRERLKPRADEMLRLVDLEKRADDLVKTFSGGMKRRLEIARGLMHEPRVLFLDEPTLGLDPATREHVWAYIRALRERQGTTVVLTTHYMEEADSLCDRIAIIDHGRIVALDTPAALKASLGGDLVTLQGGATARGRLEGLAFVRKAVTRGRDLVLTVEDAPHNLAAIVMAAGEVDGIEVRTVRLEDVFLAKTGHTLREEGAEGEMETYARHYGGG